MATRKKKAAKKTTKTRAKAAPKRATRRSAAKPARAKAVTRKGLQFSNGAPGVTVNDIGRSLDWYCDVLGFAVKQRWEQEGVLTGAELTAGDVTLYLGQDDWKKGRDRVKGEGFRLYWYTKQDIDTLAAGIKARGGTLASEPKDQWGTRTFDLVDPTGYKITVSADR